MLFRKRQKPNDENELADKIRKEITATLKSKGINIGEVQIKVNDGNINLSACILEKAR